MSNNTVNHLDPSSQGGAARIDHGAMTDNTPSPDTIGQGAETIPNNRNDLSFWGGSWYWDKYPSQLTDDPRDQWVIKPSPQLVATTIKLSGAVQENCLLVLQNKREDEVRLQQTRHADFFAEGQLPQDEVISEFIDLLNAYQSRYIEAVQQYDSKCNTYQRLIDSNTASEEQVEDASIAKSKAATKCRYYISKLEALVYVYNENAVAEEATFQLKYTFNPRTEMEATMLRINVEQTLGKIGRRMARSIKQGKMDARQYNIPLPWADQERTDLRDKTEAELDDFDAE